MKSISPNIGYVCSPKHESRYTTEPQTRADCRKGYKTIYSHAQYYQLFIVAELTRQQIAIHTVYQLL